ncbi:hypothetical protein B0T09DRAFT_134674 [Sordaria sp. MPI-SDFR-AT-0083]|nr:hypothetical protein B0T09DRAFT_134674 [Sordaria sp. MPI-SDFR-AT-0083]
MSRAMIAVLCLKRWLIHVSYIWACFTRRDMVGIVVCKCDAEQTKIMNIARGRRITRKQINIIQINSITPFQPIHPCPFQFLLVSSKT